MTFEEQEIPAFEKRKTYLLNSLKATSFSGRTISIPKYDFFPPYFDRHQDFDVTWVQSTPGTLPEADIHEEFTSSFVEKYKANSYLDLISDEKANREVLNWLRQFKENSAINKVKGSKKKKKNKKQLAAEAAAEDGKGLKSSHILILTGPSGCGKSTLVRVVAAQCNYHVVELNASEDIKSERNQLLLHNTLDFQPAFGKKTKPLLLLEEMDGIGTISDSVLKSVTSLTDRPIIIVVNNLYDPSLRFLRTQANIVRMDHPLSSKFISRLKKIADSEGIKYIPKALVDIAEQSKYDMRNALSTLQFLSIRQPVTPEMVQLIPVGVKSATFSYFDVMSQLFTLSSKLDDSLLALESFGDNRLISTGILENIENVKGGGYSNQRIADVLDNLSFSDISRNDEIAQLGLASVSKLVGVSHVGRQIIYPTDSFTLENMIRKNQKIVIGRLKECLPLLKTYMNPDQQVINTLSMRGKEDLRQEFVDFHRYANVSYTKNISGFYNSEPDIDTLLVYNQSFGNNNYNYSTSSRLTKFREFIHREMDKDKIHVTKEINKATSGMRIEDRLNKKNKDPKISVNRNFWGEIIDNVPSQISQDSRPILVYVYNEGFTNAVRRPVRIDRLLQ